MKDNRNMVNKTYMTEEEHRKLIADAKATRKSVSTLLCDCWLHWRDVKATPRPITRPAPAPFRPKLAPSRTVRPTAYMRS
jgi:hypothetical protein